jgi:DedD protein
MSVEETMKKRLVGATVLVALAVIFIPMFLEDKPPRDDELELDSSIPAEPATRFREDMIPGEQAARESYENQQNIIEIPLATHLQPESQTSFESKPAELTSEEKTESDKSASEWEVIEDAATSTKKVVAKADIKPQTSSPKPGSGWTIQAASFGQYANAESLLANLKLTGMDAYISSTSIKDKKLYRVRVGPYKSKDQAQKQLQLVEKHFNLKGSILPP